MSLIILTVYCRWLRRPAVWGMVLSLTGSCARIVLTKGVVLCLRRRIVHLAADVLQHVEQRDLQGALLRRRERVQGVADEPDDRLDVVAADGRPTRTWPRAPNMLQAQAIGELHHICHHVLNAMVL